MTSIHDRALQIVSSYKRAESQLIDLIQEIDDKKSYLEKHFTSTFDYCVKFLRLSEHTALDFIGVARKSKTVPELKEAIKNDLITVSKARRLTPVIDQANASHWLDLAQNLSKENLQKEIARANPQTLVFEKAKYVAENRLKLELGISEEVMHDLRRAGEILSQKSKAPVNFEMTVAAVLKDFLRREDPLVKAQRALEKNQRNHSNNDTAAHGPGHVNSNIPFQRGPLGAALRHQVHLRDGARCAHVDGKGQRCQERKWLQIHHLIPIAHGGQNQRTNLKTLCQGHHKVEHFRNLPQGSSRDLPQHLPRHLSQH
jgi:5-methylcytosine-specific restriction endonuclease McrA